MQNSLSISSVGGNGLPGTVSEKETVETLKQFVA